MAEPYPVGCQLQPVYELSFIVTDAITSSKQTHFMRNVWLSVDKQLARLHQSLSSYRVRLKKRKACVCVCSVSLPSGKKYYWWYQRKWKKWWELRSMSCNYLVVVIFHNTRHLNDDDTQDRQIKWIQKRIERREIPESCRERREQ